MIEASNSASPNAGSESEGLRRLEMLAESWIVRLKEPAHDAQHVRRVTRMAEHLGNVHGADLEVLIAAALLHDLGRAEEKTASRSHVELSLEIAQSLMAEAEFPAEKRDAVLHCIAAHSFSRGVPPQTLEARLLRDADRLDALGALGIARTFAHGGTFYDPDDPLARHKSELDDKRYSVEHFYVKLFKLPETLFSPESRRIAEERVAFMKEFLAHLEREALGAH